MGVEANWRTELYQDFDVYVLAIPRAERAAGKGKAKPAPAQWDFVVRVCESGADPTAVETLVAHSHDEHPLPSREDAEDAGFARGYGLVDGLLGRGSGQKAIDL
ncbi:hypothetical protein [uncultured Ralstonia sp.]|jgi:hypothetical protein|uniref:hypothetical protein n=1 Tax=Ralstonia sp. TaxID=54061 RepID=UPI001EA88626|nr:hypothetical protein [uncultured Ralstonia sp.]UCF24061.1 MAG: hypothetical protein JSV72_00580 [Ralstonia sp.]